MPLVRRVMLLAVFLTLACVDPARVNTSCTWTEPAARPLDLSKRVDRAHLREDARLAGEIEVRYADARRRTPAEMEPLVDECRARLIPTISAMHKVTAVDIDAARSARNWPVDILLVFVPMALVALLATDLLVRRVCRLFDTDSGAVAAAVTVLFVPLSAALAVGITQIWAFTVDSILLRNGHMSFRAFYNPVTRHGWIAFFVALALCACMSLWRFRRTPLTGGTGGYRPGLSVRRARS